MYYYVTNKNLDESLILTAVIDILGDDFPTTLTGALLHTYIQMKQGEYVTALSKLRRIYGLIDEFHGTKMISQARGFVTQLNTIRKNPTVSNVLYHLYLLQKYN